MKIFLFITTVGHGNGGHFYSMHTIAEEMAKSHTVTIINVGVRKSPVFVAKEYKVIFLDYNGWNFFNVALDILKLVYKEKPDVVHAFDIESFVFCRMASLLIGKDSLLTKCGGGNPKKYFPSSDKLILFSSENYLYFSNCKKFRSTEIKLIPNRVKMFTGDSERIQHFLSDHDLKGWKIIRISRISAHYNRTLAQSVDLVKRLVELGEDVSLVIIGTVQSDQVLKGLEERVSKLGLDKRVVIESSQFYTDNAKRILPLGDMVIGTGRGFMEACSLGMEVLVPSANLNYPILVDDENFYEVFNTNFSPRGVVSGLTEEVNIQNIVSTIRRKKKSDPFKWYKEYFDVTVGVEKHIKLYKSKENKNKYRALDFLVNVIYSIKVLVSSNS